MDMEFAKLIVGRKAYNDTDRNLRHAARLPM